VRHEARARTLRMPLMAVSLRAALPAPLDCDLAEPDDDCLGAFRKEFRDFVEDDAVQPTDLVYLPHRLVEARGGPW
jgi:hypothetical protein